MPSEEQIARTRVQQKLKNHQFRKVDQRFKSIREELGRVIERQDYEFELQKLSQSPKQVEQQLDDLQLIKVYQAKLTQVQKNHDFTKIQLAESQKTIDTLRDMLEKQRARTKLLEENYILKEKQQLGDQKNQYQNRIRQNLKLIDDLQAQRKQLAEHCELIQRQLLQSQQKFKRVMQNKQQQFKRELKANKQAWVSAERERKEKWQKQKQQQIKQNTVMIMEPQIQKIINTSKEEVKKAQDQAKRKILQIREQLALDEGTRIRKLKDEAFQECQKLIEEERRQSLSKQKQQFGLITLQFQREKTSLKNRFQAQIVRLQEVRKKEAEDYRNKLNKIHEDGINQQKRLRLEYEQKLSRVLENKQSFVQRQRAKLLKQKEEEMARTKQECSKQLKQKLEKALLKMGQDRDQKIALVIQKMARQKLQFQTRVKEANEEKLREQKKARQEADRRLNKEVALLEMKLKEHKDQLSVERGKREWAQQKMGSLIRKVDEQVAEEIRKAQEGLEERIIAVKLRAQQQAELKFLSKIQQLQRQNLQSKARLQSQQETQERRTRQSEEELQQLQNKWCEQVQELQQGFKKVVQKKEEEIKKVLGELKNEKQLVRRYETMLQKQRKDLMANLK